MELVLKQGPSGCMGSWAPWLDSGADRALTAWSSKDARSDAH